MILNSGTIFELLVHEDSLQCTQTLSQGHSATVRCIAPCRPGQSDRDRGLVSGSEDGTIVRWSPSGFQQSPTPPSTPANPSTSTRTSNQPAGGAIRSNHQRYQHHHHEQHSTTGNTIMRPY